jgi:hypothetical protein
MWAWATAAAQQGVVTFGQLVTSGIAPSTIGGWVASGRLVRLHHGTFAVGGSPDTFERRCWAAVLGAGGPGAAAVSHLTAAYVWGLVEDEPAIHVVVRRGRTPALRGVVVHQTRDPFTVHRRNGIPVTSPLRAMVDLGAVARDRVVEDALDRGLAGRLFTVASVEWQLVEVARRGRRGVGPLRRVLDGRALGRDRPDGLLEPRFARLCLQYGLPSPVFQHAIGRHRVDFAYPDLMIAIEVDGYSAHGSPDAFQRDRERQNELVLAGWTVLRFTWADIVKRPREVAQLVADAIGRARAGISA